MTRTILLVALVAVLLLDPMVAHAEPDDTRRSTLAAKGRVLFRNTSNHCHAYRDLVALAAEKADGPMQMLEDLKFLLIGTDLRHRGQGSHYIGGTPGARGDKGFKAELKDNSPQVEHSLAAIYVGKFYPPGATEAVALRTEVMGPLMDGGKLNSADILLWSLGGDTGQRLSNSNYKELPKVIERTQCK
jgi:hypothetical protein